MGVEAAGEFSVDEAGSAGGFGSKSGLRRWTRSAMCSLCVLRFDLVAMTVEEAGSKAEGGRRAEALDLVGLKPEPSSLESSRSRRRNSCID